MTIRHRYTYWFAGVALMLLGVVPASARTITLTDEDCEKMAFIAREAPRLSWAGTEVANGAFYSGQLTFYPTRSFLIRFPLERVPKGQRITKAEFSFTTTVQTAGEQRLELRRLVADWGPGVCWKYRRTRPNKVEWAQAGARGASTDRAARTSTIVRSNMAGEKTVNVTEDVELWYSGAVPNHGWTLSLEDADSYIIANSPLWQPGHKAWKLRITYEPE